MTKLVSYYLGGLLCTITVYRLSWSTSSSGNEALFNVQVSSVYIAPQAGT